MYNQKEKTEKTVTFFRFEDLRIYHKSLDYINAIQDITMMFPENDKSQLALRFNESARNIAFFIVEGSARNKSQFVFNLKMAKSAIRECLVYTTLSYKQSLITDSQEDESRNQLMEMTKMIGALISSLQRANNSSTNGTGHIANYKYNGRGEESMERRNKYNEFEESSTNNGFGE